MNSECEGARPSFLAILAIASMMCFLSYTSFRGVAQALLPVRVSKRGKFNRVRAAAKSKVAQAFLLVRGKRLWCGLS